jgi:hypothetical protein
MPGRHLLEDDRHRQAFVEDRRERRQADRERDRHAEDQQAEERDRENRQCHAFSTSMPRRSATMCSTENRHDQETRGDQRHVAERSEMPRVGIM